MTGYFRIREYGADLFVRLTPKAQGDIIGEVVTSSDGKSCLSARVRAVPEKGKANKALEALIARHFGFPKSSVTVIAGSTSRLKTISITGNPEEIASGLRTKICSNSR